MVNKTMLSPTAVIALSMILNLFISQNFVICEEIIEPTDREFAEASRDPVKVQVNVSPALSENEMYRDILHLTNANFTDLVLKSKDPWVVIFHDGSFFRTWKSMAASMRGIMWFGLVSKNETEILKTLGIEPGNIPPAFVFPYNYFGNPKSRKEKAVGVQSPIEARKTAARTLPDNTIKLSTGGKQTKETVQDFLIESYVGNPAKFPTLFMTYEQETPPLIKALCVRFSEYFHFGVMYDPSSEDLQAIGLEEAYIDFPALMVLVTTHENKMDALMFDTKKMGDMTYPNVMRFFYQVNEQYRMTIPGDSMSHVKRVATMSDILEIEKLRFKILGSEFDDDEEDEKDVKDEL